jgi:hypothetical protein
MTPEALLKAARQARNGLDGAAVERGEKQRASQRYVRVWSRDGLSGGSWCLPDEDGGVEINTALKLLVAKTTGGPRFTNPKTTDPRGTNPNSTDTGSGEAVEDERLPEHIMADGFAQVFHNGLTVDPSVIPGAGRAAVRVITTEKVLTGQGGTAVLEDTGSPISVGKLGEYLCEGGTIPVTLHRDGSIDVGREQRLFTTRQRTALAVRDGGCRYPDCVKPPSWCEAHHVNYWTKDKGRTDTQNGILLCRHHHMLIHNTGWQIVRTQHSGNPTSTDPSSADPGSADPGGGYWLKPPRERNPQQHPIPMPSKNPLITAITRADHGATTTHTTTTATTAA